MKPVNSCLFIKVDEEKTDSGLVLGDTGVVVYGFTWLGERVVFDLYNAKPVTVDSEKFLVIKEEDIFGVIYEKGIKSE
jgi:co-chaperonin GroES (HSP10)